MNNLQKKAFDLSDKYCNCQAGEECHAQSFMDGYIDGFKAAREQAAAILKRRPYEFDFLEETDDNIWNKSALILMTEDILSLGEEIDDKT